MSELIRKLKEKKYITKIKIKDDISDELLSKEIPQVGSVKIVAAVKEEIGPVKQPYAVMRETNPELMDVCVKYNWAANQDYMTYEEAAAITADMIEYYREFVPEYGDYMYISKFQTLKSFNEFQYFTGVEKIKDYTFYRCSGLTRITIPTSVTSIGNNVFMGCSSLTSIEIPSSVTSIGNGAFRDCYKLESIVVESDNSVYDSRSNCNAIIKTDTNTLIFGCKNTIIPNSVTSIGDGAFSGCNSLTSITIPNSVTSIGGEAFGNCSGLTSITIPNSVTSIGSAAFERCSGLTSITIPNSVTAIDSTTFEGCSGLTSITIPNSVTAIGDYVFRSCTDLTSIQCLATTAPTVQSGAFGTYDSNYTGRNTYNQGINKLKVPTGATGYDTGAWADPLQNSSKCGFTIEYI